MLLNNNLNRSKGRQVDDLKDWISILFVPIAAAVGWISKRLRKHDEQISEHSERLAVLATECAGDSEHRSEQRKEMIAAWRATIEKIDALDARFNSLLLELAKNHNNHGQD